MDSDRMSSVPQRKIPTRSDIYFNASVSNQKATFARLFLSFYLCALFIISSPPSRNDFISVGMDKSPAQRSTTSPPSLVSTPTLCFPPSTNWISRMLCWNRDEMQVREQKATRRRRQRNIDEWTGVFKSPVRALPTKLARSKHVHATSPDRKDRRPLLTLTLWPLPRYVYVPVSGFPQT